MRHGYIYVLQNRDLRANLLKIGRTMKKPIERAKEISSATGVSQPYEVVWEEAVRDCHLAEQLVHRKLEQYRVTSNREFFELPLKDRDSKFPVLGQKFPVRFKIFPVRSFREFGKKSQRTQPLRPCESAIRGLICENSLFFPV